LGENLSTEVCIVGAGIAGLTTAYLLGLEGTPVIVLNDGPIGNGMTGRTTAHLASALDDRYYNLEHYHGVEGAQMAAESHSTAIDRIEQIVSSEKIECDFSRVDGYLFLPPGAPLTLLDREFEAAFRAGLRMERVARAPISGFHTGPCLRFPRQGQFNPLAFLQGLRRAILRNGGKIFTNTRVTRVEGGKAAHVETSSGHRVDAASVVVTTNTPINDRYSIHTKQAPYTTYVIGLEIPPDSVVPALLWDTAEMAGLERNVGPVPYHYVRISKPAGRPETLIVGGEDHKTGQSKDFAARYTRLERWARVRFPMAGKVVYRWSGQVMEPVDGLAYIGRNPADEPNVYIATGDSGNGMTHGTIAGILLSDLINRGESRWQQLYNPSRKPVRAYAEYAKENFNVVAQFADYLTPPDYSSEADVPLGQGGIIRRGIKKIAAFRDDSGMLHEFSAVCPHMKCIVRWNATEKTWDCPCHGSRFDCMGRVIGGPASEDLAPIGAAVKSGAVQSGD
jgi:glycine/D-amino acid oxidase-like deaminating enzyme/nitrite reductase/ring-hydroxylating ferredoxin subunit